MKNSNPTRFTLLKKRLTKDFSRGVLLCDIRLTDEELDTLAAYTKKRVSGKNSPGTNCLCIAVFLVIVGVRYYDGSYWNHVSRLCKKELGYREQLMLGDAFYSFAIKRGLPVFADTDRVKNILAHCFVPEHFRDDLYTFLFYHYFIDLDCNISKVRRTGLYTLLDGKTDISTIDRTHMITRGTRDFAKLYPVQTNRKLYRILSVADRFYRLDKLPAKLSARDKSVIAWCESDETFRRESKKSNFGDKLIKDYAFSKPYVTKEENGYTLWLPSLMFRADEVSDADEIIWYYEGRIISYPAVTISIAGIKTEIVRCPISSPPIPGATVTIKFSDTEKEMEIVDKST